MPPRSRSRPLSHFIEPCLPRAAAKPPAGQSWLHEIKHDGFRIVARRDSRGVRLFTRNGFNFANRFPKIVDAVSSLPVRSCVIDSESPLRRGHSPTTGAGGPRSANRTSDRCARYAPGGPRRPNFKSVS